MTSRFIIHTVTPFPVSSCFYRFHTMCNILFLKQMAGKVNDVP